jgi:hypothetical protein
MASPHSLQVDTTYRQIIKLALPISFAMLIPQFNFVTTNIFLGHYNQESLAIADRRKKHEEFYDARTQAHEKAVSFVDEAGQPKRAAAIETNSQYSGLEKQDRGVDLQQRQIAISEEQTRILDEILQNQKAREAYINTGADVSF